MNILRSFALLFGFFLDLSFSVSSPNNMYAVGGDYSGYNILQSVERYDPASDIWTSVASMSTKRSQFAVGVVLQNNKQYLYAVGAFDGSGRLQTVEKYDPSNDIWTSIASMSTGRSGLAGGVLTFNETQHLYAVGGYNGCDLQSVERYDPSNDIWTSVASMSTRRSCLAVGVLTFNKTQYMYAVGGQYYDNGVKYLQTVERYDPLSDIWTSVASMSTKRSELAVGVLTHSNDGKQYLYAIGGKDGTEPGSNFLQTVERYDPLSDTWTSVASMSTKRVSLAVGVLTHSNDGKQYMYAVGGVDGSDTLQSVERYDPSNDIWTLVASMSTKRLRLAVGVLTGFCNAGEYYLESPDHCELCPAGYVCDEGTTDASKALCPAGYVCDAGTTPATENDLQCPAGYVCDEGTSSASKVVCPAGYVCPEGTTSQSLFNYPCPSGMLCPEGSSPASITVDASSYDYPPQFIAAVSIFGAALLLSAIIVLYSKQRKHNEHAKYGAMLSFPFGLLDFMLDGVFLSSTLLYSGPDPTVKLIGYISLSFVVVPLFVNLLCMVRIIRREIKENEAFSVWFSKNSAPFILLIVMCSTNSGAILITCCGVGGYSVLSAPWSPHALLKLNAIGLVTNLGEDLPQTVIQLLYIFFTNTSGNIPDFIIVSITTSLLMVVNNVVRRCLGLTNDKEQLRRAETLNRGVPMLQAKYAFEEEEDEQLRIQLQQIEARRAKLKEKLKKKSQVF